MQGNIDPREIWLTYFNIILYEKGVINKNEHDKMTQLIRKQCHTPTRVNSNNKNLKEIY